MTSDGEEQGGWLPPEPPGPEPDRTQPPPPPVQPQAPQPQQPPQQQTSQYQQPAYYQQYPAYAEPGNGNAVAALVLGIVGLGILLSSIGLGAPLSLAVGIVAIVIGRRGRNAVDSGQTRKHRGLAQAGFILGIVTVVLSVLAGGGWIAAFVSDPDILDELDETDSDDPFSTIVLLAARVAAMVAP